MEIVPRRRDVYNSGPDYSPQGEKRVHGIRGKFPSPGDPVEATRHAGEYKAAKTLSQIAVVLSAASSDRPFMPGTLLTVISKISHYNGSERSRSEPMIEFWKQWEGTRVDDVHTLEQYLFGAGDHAVFLSRRGDETQERAAVKIVVADPAAIERRLELWKTAASLSHPLLIHILSSGKSERDGVTFIYLVTEFADEDLSQAISGRPITEKETQELLVPTLEALQYLHKRGFAHGHLKPSNFMAVDGSLKISSDRVCPFGERDDDARDSYSPPEQNRHSAAGDVWSLGVTLVEALTQHLPASDSEQAPLIASLPEPFRNIVRHCLRPDPETRWKVSDIVASLERPTQERPAQERPAQERSVQRLPEQSAKRTDRRWFYAVAIVAVLVILAALLGPRILHRQAETPPRSGAENISTPLPKPNPPITSSPSEVNAPAPPVNPAASEVIERVLPDIPAKARRTIQGKVKIDVRVRVDSSGTVTSSKLEHSGPSKYFGQLTLDAARQWRFAPLKTADPKIPRERILRFEISRSDTKVAIARVVR